MFFSPLVESFIIFFRQLIRTVVKIIPFVFHFSSRAPGLGPDPFFSKTLKTNHAAIKPLTVPHTTLQRTLLRDISSSSSGIKSIYHVSQQEPRRRNSQRQSGYSVTSRHNEIDARFLLVEMPSINKPPIGDEFLFLAMNIDDPKIKRL